VEGWRQQKTEIGWSLGRRESSRGHVCEEVNLESNILGITLSSLCTQKSSRFKYLNQRTTT
jgi:hypothetical protein